MSVAAARVVHRAPGRLRLRVPARRGEHAWFARVTEELVLCPAVQAVEANPVTASILVRFGAGFSLGELAEVARAASLFTLTPGIAADSALVKVEEGLRGLDQRLRALTGGEADVRSLVFVGLLGLAAVQFLRGQFLGPASTLLWQAFDLAGGKSPFGEEVGNG